jgi:hypothetical protein
VAQLAGAVDVVEVERVGAFHRTTASRAGCAVDQRVKLASSFGAVLACVVGPAPVVDAFVLPLAVGAA